MLTEEEVAAYLRIPQSEIERLIKRGKLTAFRIGGSYLRFRKEEVEALKAGKRFVAPDELQRSWKDKAIDVWKFYNFYILSSLFIVALILLFIQFQ